jgi:hypothetical protein
MLDPGPQLLGIEAAEDGMELTQGAKRATVRGSPLSGIRNNGDPRVMAILCALLLFCHVLAGFHNRDLVQLVGSHRPYTARQATYDLRRLRRKGLIMRVPGSQRYQLTPLGRRVACSSLKLTDAFSARALPFCNPTYPSRSASGAHSPAPGANSSGAWTTSLRRSSSRPEI